MLNNPKITIKPNEGRRTEVSTPTIKHSGLSADPQIGGFMPVPSLSLWDNFLIEFEDSEKEYIRYLSKDIAFLQELKEEYKNDWEMEELISFLIHEEANLMDYCKRRWLYAQRKTESEGIPGPGSSYQQPRNADAFKQGNLFLNKSQVKDVDP